MEFNMYSASINALVRRLRAGLVLCVAVTLVACGGEGDPSLAPPPFGGTASGSGGIDPNAPTASDLSLVLTNASGVQAQALPNDGSSTIIAKATAVDANRNALPGIPVTISVDNGAVATVSGSTSDESGVVTAKVGIGNNRANRTITVTAASGGLTRTASFQLIGSTLTSTPLPGVIAPGAAGQVDFRLVDSTGNPMGGQQIVVNGVAGVETTGTIDANGSFAYSYTAPTATGNLDIRATAGGVARTQTVLVQTSGSGAIPPATVSVQSASLAASPSVVPVNLDNSNSNRAELRALFLGAGNAPVKNVRVRFDLAGDLNSIGGSLTSGANVVYSDSNGVATTAYVPGSRFSPTDGVTVRACWSENDFPAKPAGAPDPVVGSAECPKATTATVTVISEALSVSIGTNDKIEIGPTGLDYIKKYLVQVNDSSGLAKGGVQISPSIDLVTYSKGYWTVQGLGTEKRWVQTVTSSCDNEDLNRNGVLEIYANGAVEDANGTKHLEPRKADVNISFVGSSTTNSDGQVVLKITYPQSLGSWIEFKILVAASGVAGTEGRTSYQGVLPVLSTAVLNVDVEVPFRLAPYGIEPSPVVLTTNPEGQSGLLCTNPK